MAQAKHSRGKPDGRETPKRVIEKRAGKKGGRKKEIPFAAWVNKNQANLNNIPKSKILDAFLPDRTKFYKSRDHCTNEDSYILFENFSFLENPIGTMNMLSEMVKLNSCAANNDIHFTDPICWDMAPYMVLNLLENDLESERIRGGTVTPFVRKILEETDFAKHFNMNTEGELDQNLEIWPIKIDSCKQSGPDSYKDNSSPHAALAERFTGQIENWLKETGFALTDEGIRLLMCMIGEVLNNAILHSSEEIGGEAWISGFMLKTKNPAGEVEYACHISILNLGKTIFESMQQCEPTIRGRIEQLIKTHRPKFRLRKHWTPEGLWTLYALQDGVTSMGKKNDPRGGRGLMDMITFFSDIGRSHNSKLAIISGGIAINISDPNPLEDNRGMRRLALNDENDLAKAPKKEYMKVLRKPFPGTILTWRFFLNPKHLEKLANA